MELKRVIEILESVFIIAIVAFLLYANIAYYVFNHVILAVVIGKSMLPLLQENDVVIILPGKNIGLGDIIVFKNDRGEYVIHRVVAIAECQNGVVLYITKGDNNLFVDSVSWGIALRTSIECRVKNVSILQGFEQYVQQAFRDGSIRGIPSDRVVGKALTFFNMVVKITGLPSLKL